MEGNWMFRDILYSIFTVVTMRFMRLLFMLTTLLLAMNGLERILKDYHISLIVGHIASAFVILYIMTYIYQLYKQEIISFFESMTGFFEWIIDKIDEKWLTEDPEEKDKNGKRMVAEKKRRRKKKVQAKKKGK